MSTVTDDWSRCSRVSERFVLAVARIAGFASTDRYRRLRMRFKPFLRHSGIPTPNQCHRASVISSQRLRTKPIGAAWITKPIVVPMVVRSALAKHSTRDNRAHQRAHQPNYAVEHMFDLPYPTIPSIEHTFGQPHPNERPNGSNGPCNAGANPRANLMEPRIPSLMADIMPGRFAVGFDIYACNTVLR